MKKLIIALVGITAYFLFFSSSNGAEWAEDQTGCQVWNGSTKSVEKVEWSGKCVDGYASGKGTINMFWKVEDITQKNNPKVECSGNLKKGKLNGYNECKWANGKSYKGTFKEDYVVKGEYTYKDGHKEKVKWFEENNGCLVWNPFPQPDEQATWNGECYNGYAKGEGTLKFISKDIEQTYIGEMSKGKYDGKGSYHWVKHNKSCETADNINYCLKEFSGVFKKGSFEKGVYTLLNGTKIEKKNVQDQLSWARDQNKCLVWNEGNLPLEKTTWTGECVDGYASGKGTITMLRTKVEKDNRSSQIECVGQLQQGKLAGYNDCKWSKGNFYSGLLKGNMFHGKGTYTWADGSVYKGLWAEDMRYGQGELIWGNGESYSGTWKNNQPHGKGTYKWAQHKEPCTEINRFYCYKTFIGNFIKGSFEKGTFTRFDGKKVKQTLAIRLSQKDLIEQAKGNWVKSPKGCKLWNASDMLVKKTTWTGKCDDGYASGQGSLTMVWKSDKEDQSIACTGTLKKGKLDGQNECKWGNGISYKGTFKDEHFLAGEYTYPSGSTSKEKWFEEKNGCLVWNPAPQTGEQVSWDGACFLGYAKGQGTLKFTSKAMDQKFVGEMHKGKKNGKGTFYWLKHDKPCDEKKSIHSCYKNFEGEFYKGDFDKGTFTLLSGRKIANKGIVERGKQLTIDGMAGVKALTDQLNFIEVQRAVNSATLERLHTERMNRD